VYELDFLISSPYLPTNERGRLHPHVDEWRQFAREWGEPNHGKLPRYIEGLQAILSHILKELNIR